MTGVGFIGVGEMGRLQSQSFAQVKSAKVVAGADLSEASRKAFAGQHPGAAIYEDYHALLADPKVQVVVVSVPTGFHVDVAGDALKAGKAVLCEKPMARTVAQCRKLMEIAKKSKSMLMIAHCRRFDTNWGTMGRIVTSGKLGGPVCWRHFIGGRGPAAKWFFDDKLGGGPLLDGAVHNHDFANLIFGKPVSVIAQSIDLTGSSAVNTATAIVEYEKGDQMVLSWSWGIGNSSAAGMDILGPKGTLNLGPGKLDSDKLDHKKYGYFCVTNQATNKPSLVKFPKRDMYVTQAKHFIDAAAGKTPCQSPPEEAIKAVAVAEGIFKSAKAHGKRVKISW